MKRTIRSLLKWSYPLDAALLAFVLVDFWFWDSRGMVVLLGLLGLLLVGVVVLLAVEERPKYLRLPTREPEPPITIIYGRDTHGRP